MKKNEILIIESRSPSDIYNDTFEAKTLQQVLKLQDVDSKRIEVVNKQLLAKALKLAEKEHIKYVHISAHGAPGGFALTDGEFITWRDFDELAWPHLKNTCVCFSSCSVGSEAEEIFTYHKSFCNAIVAPTRKISWSEGLVAFSAFYHRALSQETSTSQDVKVLNHIVGAGTFKFIESSFRSDTYTIG